LLEVAPATVAAWFHRLFTGPFVDIDGVEHQVKRGATDIALAEGAHHIKAYVRYRGRRDARLAEASRSFFVGDVGDVGDGSRLLGMTIRLGPRNGSSFRISAPEPVPG